MKIDFEFDGGPGVARTGCGLVLAGLGVAALIAGAVGLDALMRQPFFEDALDRMRR